MGKYSSDSDSEKRGSKSSYKSRSRRRSSSSESSSSRSRHRKDKDRKSSRRRSKSNSKYSKSRRSRSRSTSRHYKKSSRRSRTPDRHRSKRSASRSRSRSYIREYTSRPRKRSSDSTSSTSSTSSKSEKSSKTALKPSNGNVDMKHKNKILTSGVETKVLDEINSDNFSPKQFASSRSKKLPDNIVIDLKKQTIKVPEVEPVEPDSIFHHNLFVNEEARMEKWVKELYSYRQKALQQGLKSNN